VGDADRHPEDSALEPAHERSRDRWIGQRQPGKQGCIIGPVGAGHGCHTPGYEAGAEMDCGPGNVVDRAIP